MFAKGPGDLGSFPGYVIPKTFKMVLDTSLQCKVRIKSKVENPRKGVALSPTPSEKGAFWSPSTTVAKLYFFFNNDL